MTASFTGLAPLPIALGGARWSLTETPDEVLARATLYAALDGGVTLVDTAPAYTAPPYVSHNERLIGEALRRHPSGDQVLLITKCGYNRDLSGEFYIDARPETIVRQCRASLKALGRERIDLYLLHWPDPQVPMLESLGAMAELRAAGLVAAIGVCNVELGQLRQLADAVRIDAVENKLSLLNPEDLPVVTECERRDLAYLAYSPLGGPAGAARLACEEPDSVLGAIAMAHGVTPQQIAIAWLLATSPAVIAIVGAGRPSSIADALSATSLSLSESELGDLRGLVARWN